MFVVQVILSSGRLLTVRVGISGRLFDDGTARECLAQARLIRRVCNRTSKDHAVHLPGSCGGSLDCGPYTQHPLSTSPETMLSPGSEPAVTKSTFRR